MNRMKYTVKPDPDALDLSNRPQHLLSPSIDNEDDDEYLHSEDEQHHDTIEETSNFCIKVIYRISFFLFRFRTCFSVIVQKTTYDSGFVDTSDENNDLTMVKQGKDTLENLFSYY